MSMSQSLTSQHWSHLQQCTFIQLAMIGAQGQRRGRPEEKTIRLAQSGKIKTIISHKKSSMITLHSLFPFPPKTPQPLVVLPPPPPGRVCLVEGAPGGGKSSLALHICHQWAQHASWLAQFDLVVLAYLRDEAIQNAITLPDILPARNSEMSLHAASQIQAADGQNVLFIFDGWDEFPPHLMESSLVSKIIRQPHRLSLHQSTVLITSRPVSSGNLLSIAERRVEILGFTQQQIHEYIEKSLDGNIAETQRLVQHLEEHPVIESYCYIPLHVAILVHIFLTLNGILPTTLHELFCALVLCCIVREQETHGSSLPEISSLDDLPDDLKSKLSYLCKLAYNGIMENKVVFYLEDLKSSDLPYVLSSLGLLQAVEGLTLLSKSLSYNFLHLSVQELLAAYYISQMDPKQQLAVFKELFTGFRFQAVLHYYCGFSKLVNPEIQAFIASYQQKHTKLNELFLLLHCFFEAQQPSLCRLIKPRFLPTEEIPFDCKNLAPADILALGFFITSLLHTSTADSHVNFSIEGIHDHQLKLLFGELSNYPVGGLPSTGALPEKQLVLKIAKLNFVNIQKNGPALTKLLQINKSLTHLDLSGNLSLPALVFGFIFEGLQYNTTLVNLKLSNTSISAVHPDIAKSLKEMLLVNKSLTHLDLSCNIGFPSFVLGFIFEGLQYNTALVKLNLSNTCVTAIGRKTLKSLAKMLQLNTSLTHLDLSLNFNKGFSDPVICCIFEGLQHNTALVKINLSNIGITAVHPDIVKSLKEMLQVNKTLTHLDLSGNISLPSLVFEFIFQGLQYNTTLVNLNLSNSCVTAIGRKTLKSLAKMLQLNTSLTHLDLSFNKAFSDPFACCIFEGLQHNTTLVQINLSNTGITGIHPDIAKSLKEMLLVNKSLTHLDLSGNISLPSLVFEFIFEGLQYNTALVNLNLSNTSITHMGRTTLKSLAKMFQLNTSLTHLDLSFNKVLSDPVACCIFKGLQHNTTLVKINLSNTGIPAVHPDIVKSLKEMLLVNKTLTHLDLSNTNLAYFVPPTYFKASNTTTQ